MGKSSELNEARLDAFFTTLQDELGSSHFSDWKVAFAAERLRTRARKRAEYVNPVLDREARDKFVATNEVVRSIRVDRSSQVIKDARHYITVALERFTSSLYPEEIQNPLVVDFLWDNWRFGPGSSNGVKGTHAALKIVQPMTCTKLSEPFVRKLRQMNPYFASYDAQCGGDGTTLVNGSRLDTVPKNQETSRTIAIEPSGSMALQLAAGMYLEGTLRSIGLDIRKQEPLNQGLARAGSIDGSFATIDLRSASDMISIDLVRALLPPEWFRLLCTIRSGSIEVKGHGDIQLHMISTMGNGFTFPLMTLLLTALIYGYRAQRRGPNLYIDWARTAVYGDDIIVPSTEFAGLCEVLESVGLVVNTDKSYSEGPFRESCGGDYYEGYDVTPFYVTSLATPAEVYVALNQVLGWCGRHKVCLSATIIYLRGLVGQDVRLVPEWYGDPQGLRTAQCPRKYSYLSEVKESMTHHGSHFSLPLICGGYISSSGSDMVFVPRKPQGIKPKYKVRHARLPEGYLAGWDPLTRSRPTSEWVSLLIDIFFR